MDPLSVIASVAGIITAATQAAKLLSTYATATKSAAGIASQIHSEVLQTKVVLRVL